MLRLHFLSVECFQFKPYILALLPVIGILARRYATMYNLKFFKGSHVDKIRFPILHIDLESGCARSTASRDDRRDDHAGHRPRSGALYMGS